MPAMQNSLTPLSPAERALRERFEAIYATCEAPVMRAIERSVCGCDYGATSWTTREEADRIGALLALGSGVRLLDLGAGTGWPALYLAKTTGCDVTLTDLPATGLRIAMERALADREPGVRGAAVADGAALPFRAAAFDAISHSDVPCCLPRKREVLAACRHIIRDGGRMAFSILAVAPDLAPASYSRAVANGPDFIGTEADYPTLLRETGWSLDQEQRDELALDRRRVVADLVIARRRPRRRVLQPVQRRLAGERRAVRPPRLELAGEHRHHRIMAQLVVVDQVLVTQRQGEHTLANQRRDAVLRQRRIATVLETSRKTRDQANRPLRGPQQKRAAVRRHRTAVKRCLNAPALNACKSEQIRDTLCWHRGDPPSQLKFLLQQSLSLIRGPDALLRVRNPG